MAFANTLMGIWIVEATNRASVILQPLHSDGHAVDCGTEITAALLKKKKKKQWTEPPRLEFLTVRGLFYIKKI